MKIAPEKFDIGDCRYQGQGHCLPHIPQYKLSGQTPKHWYKLGILY